MDSQPVLHLLAYLDRVGTVGLAFMVYAFMRGWIVTKREHDREIARTELLISRLDKAMRTLPGGRRAVDPPPETHV